MTLVGFQSLGYARLDTFQTRSLYRMCRDEIDINLLLCWEYEETSNPKNTRGFKEKKTLNPSVLDLTNFQFLLMTEKKTPLHNHTDLVRLPGEKNHKLASYSDTDTVKIICSR